MAFIAKADLLSAIRLEELNQITRSDDTVVAYGCDVAIAEMKSYLVKHYDIDLIFAQTTTNRHPLLLNFGIDIAIYIIVSAALPGQDLEDRRARYKRAIDWLKGLMNNDINTDLPKIDTMPDAVSTRGKVGEHHKRNNYFSDNHDHDPHHNHFY